MKPDTTKRLYRNLALAAGVAMTSPALHATTLQFSGQVTSINQVVLNSPDVQVGMAISGTFTYDSAAVPIGGSSSSSWDSSTYSTGTLTLNIGNSVHLSTTNLDYPFLSVSNQSIGKDSITFSTQNFSSNINIPHTGGTNPIYRSNYLSMNWLAPNGQVLNTSANLSPEVLLNSLFSKTLEFKVDGSIYGIPCNGDDWDLSCNALEYYSVKASITSISEVPLPPSALFSASSLALLMMYGKRKRKAA